MVVQDNIISRERSKSIQGDHLGSIQEKLEKVSIYEDLLNHQDNVKHGIPSSEYEELRRRIRNNVQEMW